jgi:hypothetical protein
MAIAQPFYALRTGHPLNSLTAVSGVACPQGKWPAAIFYPLGNATPYAYATLGKTNRGICTVVYFLGRIEKVHEMVFA